MTNRKNLFIILVLAGIVLFGASIMLFSNLTNVSLTTEEQVGGVEGDPVDIVLDFYSDWIEARTATDTDPYMSGLTESEALSTSIREKLSNGKTEFTENGKDLILCSDTPTLGIRSRTIFKNDDSVQVMIFDKEHTSPIQRAVTLTGNNGLWQITSIQCSAGEQALEQGEFSFDNVGYLLKDSLPENFDKQNWYLIFEQNDVKGYTAPLFFNEDSVCRLEDGAEITCANNLFTEAQQVHVQGTMTEAGAEVSRLELLSGE